MADEKIKYADLIEANKKRWEESSSEQKEGFLGAVDGLVEGFLLWWDTLKAIEEKFNIDVMGIAREERWKNQYEHGQRLAKNFKEHGIKDLYAAYGSTFEGICEKEYFEFNDDRYYMWIHHCPVYDAFKKVGRSDEEIKEMAPLFCLEDQAIMQGFNPELEVHAQSRLLMRGEGHCTYFVEDFHGKK